MGQSIEPQGPVDRGVVMVAPDDHGATLFDQIDTFARVWSISDDVPETDNVADRLRLDVRKYGLESFEVRVYI